MPVWIDDAPAIAHSKVVILDNRVVLTDGRVVAGWFTRNWEERRSASRRFEPE